MKKLTTICLVFLLATQFMGAQNKRIYVSKHGGEPKFFRGFNLGYYSARYTNISDHCDTLICKGSGLERGTVDKYIFNGKPDENTKYYDAFNSAIRKTEKHIKRTKSKDGSLTLAISGQKVSVKYYNADKKGNADIEIELL